MQRQCSGQLVAGKALPMNMRLLCKPVSQCQRFFPIP